MKIKLLESYLPEEEEAQYLGIEGESYGKVTDGEDERPLLVIKDKAYRAVDIDKLIAKYSDVVYLQSHPFTSTFLTELLALKYYSEHLERPRYVPEGYDFALILTGDVDRIRYKITHGAEILTRRLSRGYVKESFKRLISFLSRRDLKETIKKLSKELPITIFRLPRDGSVHTSNYSWEDVPDIPGESGFHTPLAVSVLGEPIEKYLGSRRFFGARSHFLMISKKLVRELVEFGFLYDATLGYSYSNKPRGAITPFYVYLDGKKTHLVEIGHGYSDVSYTLGMSIDPMIEAAKKYAGAFTINRHPRFRIEDFPCFYENLYKIIDYAERKNARVTNAINYVRWFTSKY